MINTQTEKQQLQQENTNNFIRINKNRIRVKHKCVY